MLTFKQSDWMDLADELDLDALEDQTLDEVIRGACDNEPHDHVISIEGLSEQNEEYLLSIAQDLGFTLTEGGED